MLKNIITICCKEYSYQITLKLLQEISTERAIYLQKFGGKKEFSALQIFKVGLKLQLKSFVGESLRGGTFSKVPPLEKNQAEAKHFLPNQPTVGTVQPYLMYINECPVRHYLKAL